MYITYKFGNNFSDTDKPTTIQPANHPTNQPNNPTDDQPANQQIDKPANHLTNGHG